MTPPAVHLESIAELWESYRAECVPADASEEQVRESKQAFYGGVAAFYFQIMGGIGCGRVSEDVGEAYLEGIEREIAEFVAADGLAELRRSLIRARES